MHKSRSNIYTVYVDCVICMAICYVHSSHMHTHMYTITSLPHLHTITSSHHYTLTQAQQEYQEGEPEWCEDDKVSYETQTKVRQERPKESLDICHIWIQQSDWLFVSQRHTYVITAAIKTLDIQSWYLHQKLEQTRYKTTCMYISHSLTACLLTCYWNRRAFGMLLVINIFVFLYCPSSPLLTPGVWYEAAGVLAARAAVGPGEGLSPCTETVRHSAGTRRRPAGGR